MPDRRSVAFRPSPGRGHLLSLLARLAPHLPYVRRYARALTGDQTTGDHYVRVIGAEPVIAADIEALVKELGHTVVDIAATRSEAVDAVARKQPGLVLADIQLADGSSGIDAVKDILTRFDVPVIFITAFPERLLTGERPEPTFLITKPFQPETVKAAIGQALFFHPRKAAKQAA